MNLAVVAMDSCFALIGAYLHGIAVGGQPVSHRPFFAEESASSTQHMLELLDGMLEVLARPLGGVRMSAPCFKFVVHMIFLSFYIVIHFCFC